MIVDDEQARIEESLPRAEPGEPAGKSWARETLYTQVRERFGETFEIVLARGTNVDRLEFIRRRTDGKTLAVFVYSHDAVDLRLAVDRIEDAARLRHTSQPIRTNGTRHNAGAREVRAMPPAGPQPSALARRKAEAALRRGDRREQPVPVAPAIIEEEGDSEPILPRRDPEVAAAGNGRY